MAITRRQFIKRTGLATAGTLLGPGLFGSPFVRRAMADIGNKHLVVIFLDGGNDGLNTVVPYDNVGGLRTAYNTARLSGRLRLEPGQLSVPSAACVDSHTGAQLGFHPGLGAFSELYDLGKLAVIQGCGYPDYNLSHEESRVIWESGNPLGLPALAGKGWVGRHLIAEGYSATDIPALCIQDSIPGELRQSATGVLTVNELENFGFPYDDFGGPPEQALQRNAFDALCGLAIASGQPTYTYIGNNGRATLTASEAYPPLHGLYLADRASWNAEYDDIDRSTSSGLREIAKVIYGVRQGVPGIDAHFFQLSNGGYDTHSSQGAAQPDGDQYVLHKELADSLRVFYYDLADMGAADDTLVVVWSEFSRRIRQNDSNGTDHGSQGPMFVLGGSVNGGVYGRHPDIQTAVDESVPGAETGDGNTHYSQAAGGFRSTDFRDVYGTILKHWAGMTPAQILAPTVLPLDVGPAADYWTVANFDLGFLP
jgi:uncharacterized protein (DUF1501 family)